MRNNQIGDQGATAIAKALEVNGALTKLVEYNGINHYRPWVFSASAGPAPRWVVDPWPAEALRCGAQRTTVVELLSDSEE